MSTLPRLATSRSRKRKAECATLLTASPYNRLLEDKDRVKATKAKGRGTQKAMPKLEKESVRLKEKERERGVAKLLGKEGRAKGSATKGRGMGQSSDEEEDEEWP